MKFSLKVATSFEIYIEKMQDVEFLALQMVINKIKKLNQKLVKLNKTPKVIT